MARIAADRHAPKTINEACSWSDDVHAQQREWKLRQERTGVTPADKLRGYGEAGNKFNRSDVIPTEAEWQVEAAMQSIDICISRRVRERTRRLAAALLAPRRVSARLTVMRVAETYEQHMCGTSPEAPVTVRRVSERLKVLRRAADNISEVKITGLLRGYGYQRFR